MLSGASSFDEAEKRSGDEKAAGNTLCIFKVFEDVWTFFCPSKPCVSLSTEGTIINNKKEKRKNSLCVLL